MWYVGARADDCCHGRMDSHRNRGVLFVWNLKSVLLKGRLLMRHILTLLATTSLLLLSNCGRDNSSPVGSYPVGLPTTQPITPVSSVSPYQDVRWKDLRQAETQLDTNIVKTFLFNEGTVWPPGFKAYAESLLSKGKNPGLGIRNIHRQGLTGKGVAVAIIDQNLCQAHPGRDHPEFAGKIVEYHDVGCNQPVTEGSMHGPAVASLLVGSTIGTAPDARVYYVAAPMWRGDAEALADALDWITERNSGLSDNMRIRVVSVSAAPSGPGSPFRNGAAWDSAFARATRAGILVLDCTWDHCITTPCYYDLNDPEDLSKCTPGFPGAEQAFDSDRLCVPLRRTTAEQYHSGSYSYQYTGRGGLSWTVPYVAGVLALGWQLRPDLSGEQVMHLLRASAYSKGDQIKVVNPTAFIDSVRAHPH